MGYLLTCRTNISHSFISSLQKLTGQKATPDHAAVLLEKRFSNLAPRKETIVLLVDEVRTIFKEEIFPLILIIVTGARRLSQLQ